MADKIFLKLQHSESMICSMAANILSGFISSGALSEDNEEELINRSLTMALKIALKADKKIDSDDESRE
ncbi:MAG: hypothetical protein C0622_10530 [Desulfuromonas sp.]|nr:MAG: hypothetical protein C0622_10530 [Desulfuromonas sp.]